MNDCTRTTVQTENRQLKTSYSRANLERDSGTAYHFRKSRYVMGSFDIRDALDRLGG